MTDTTTMYEIVLLNPTNPAVEALFVSEADMKFLAGMMFECGMLAPHVTVWPPTVPIAALGYENTDELTAEQKIYGGKPRNQWPMRLQAYDNNETLIRAATSDEPGIAAHKFWVDGNWIVTPIEITQALAAYEENNKAPLLTEMQTAFLWEIWLLFLDVAKNYGGFSVTCCATAAA